MAAIRTFIAIPLTGEVRQRVGRRIDALRPHARGIRWVAAENLHLTLRFLGDVEEARLPEVACAVAAAAEGEGPFMIGAGEVGAFPSLSRPRVLWMGVEGEVETLRRLQRRIENALVERGFPGEDRPFSPHLTIGRATRDRRASVNLPQAPAEAAPVTAVREVLVLKSDLRPGGPVYTPLANVGLT